MLLFGENHNVCECTPLETCGLTNQKPDRACDFLCTSQHKVKRSHLCFGCFPGWLCCVHTHSHSLCNLNQKGEKHDGEQGCLVKAIMYGVHPNSTASGDKTRASGDVFTNLYPALVQCFFIILLGYGSGRVGIFPPVMAKGLGKFLSHIILPAFLFKAMVTLNFEDVNWKFLAALLLAKGIVFFLVSVLGYVSSRPMNIGRAGIYAIFTTQSNDFAFGYPIRE